MGRRWSYGSGLLSVGLLGARGPARGARSCGGRPPTSGVSCMLHLVKKFNGLGMLMTLPTIDDQALRESAQRFGETLAAAVAPGDPDGEGSFGEVMDAILDLTAVVPDGIQDTDLKHLLKLTVEARDAVAAGDRVRALETNAYCRLLLRRILEHSAVGALDDPATAFSAVEATLPAASTKDMARLLGVSEKTISTWRAGGTIERGAARVTTIAQICHHLRSTFTGTGILGWFDTSTRQLGKRTPLEAISQGDAGDVVEFASRIHG